MISAGYQPDKQAGDFLSFLYQERIEGILALSQECKRKRLQPMPA
jgi:hypothetical protein